MPHDNRSPKRNRQRDGHHKSDRCERSRDKINSSSSHWKSSHDERDNRKYDKSDSSRSSHSSKKFDTQRGIDAARNRLRASLSTAITDLKVQDREHFTTKQELESHNFSDTLSVLDSVNRQKVIEEIEGDGFVPSHFNSTRGGGKESLKMKKNNSTAEADIKIHDKAIFGALWTSREIEKKVLKDKNDVKQEPNIDEDVDANAKEDTTIETAKTENTWVAHERLSVDPIIRQQKWLEIFRERRRELIESN